MILIKQNNVQLPENVNKKPKNLTSNIIKYFITTWPLSLQYEL